MKFVYKKLGATFLRPPIPGTSNPPRPAPSGGLDSRPANIEFAAQLALAVVQVDRHAEVDVADIAPRRVDVGRLALISSSASKRSQRNTSPTSSRSFESTGGCCATMGPCG